MKALIRMALFIAICIAFPPAIVPFGILAFLAWLDAGSTG